MTAFAGHGHIMPVRPAAAIGGFPILRRAQANSTRYLKTCLHAARPMCWMLTGPRVCPNTARSEQCLHWPRKLQHGYRELLFCSACLLLLPGPTPRFFFAPTVCANSVDMRHLPARLPCSPVCAPCIIRGRIL